MDTDTALLARYADQHEAEAYTELARRYGKLVYGTSLRIVGNRADAEDVTQECFLSLARQAGQVRRSVAGWLHAAARTRSLDTVRERRRRQFREAQISPAQARGASDDVPWEAVERLVDEAIAQLPEESRQVIQLHFLAGRTQSQTAAELGISQATVSRRIDAGIDSLRGLLKARGVVATAAALGVGLSAEAQRSIPPALEQSLVKIGLAGMGQPTATAGGFMLGALIMTGKLKFVVIAAMVLAALGGIYITFRGDAAAPARSPSAPAAAVHPASTAASATMPASLMDEMRPADGEWQRDSGDWVGAAGVSGFAHLVSPRSWAADAIVAEFDARVETEGGDSAPGVLCRFSASATPEQSAQARDFVDEFCLRGSRAGHPCYPWSSVGLGWPAASWSRERLIVGAWADVGIATDRWYHVKAERLGTMLRLWVDGVAVGEMLDDRPAPKAVYVWLAGKSSRNRFRNLNVFRPDEKYIARYSKPATLFSPTAQCQEILARYPDTIAVEASVKLAETTTPAGLDEVAFGGCQGEAAQDKQGQPCRRFVNSDRSKGANYALADKRAWGDRDEVYAEIEYLDAGPGSFSLIYQARWGFVPTADVVLGDSGRWKKVRLYLREADLSRAPGACLWLAGLRTPQEELYLRSVRLIAVSKPKEAWEEVVRAYRREIEQRRGEWTVLYYMVETARILKTKLNRADEAAALLRAVAEKDPSAACPASYQRWRETEDRP